MPMTDPSTDAVTRKSGRRQLMLLFLLFVLPVAIAYMLYFGGWRPDQTRNYGELVVPPRPVGEMILKGLDGKSQALTDFRGKWLLVYVGPASCPTVCMDNLYKMRQVRAAQAKDAPRLERLFIVTVPDGLATLPSRLRDHPGLQVLVSDASTLPILSRLFALPSGAPPAELGRIYVIDPLGNFMMSYPPDADPSRMRKDMVRLLQVSQVG